LLIIAKFTISLLKINKKLLTNYLLYDIIICYFVHKQALPQVALLKGEKMSFVIFMGLLSLPLIIGLLEAIMGRGTTLAACKFVAGMPSIILGDDHLKVIAAWIAMAVIALGVLSVGRGFLFSDIDKLQAVPQVVEFGNQDRR
jgi:uncharacterized membrane protein YobD (UPF0266 family)